MISHNKNGVVFWSSVMTFGTAPSLRPFDKSYPKLGDVKKSKLFFITKTEHLL